MRAGAQDRARSVALRPSVGGLALLAAALVGTCWSAATRADAAALESLPLPPATLSRPVGTDLVQNGRRLSIAALELAGSVDDALAFYRAAWPADRDGPGHLVERVGDWTVVSRLVGEVQLVVQLLDGVSGPHGFASAMSLRPVVGVAPEPPPMPAGGELLSTTSTGDAGLAARTSVVASSARAGEVAGFYRDAMRRAGWRLVSERATGGPVTLLFDGRDARLEIVVTDVDGSSVAVLNEVRGGG